MPPFDRSHAASVRPSSRPGRSSGERVRFDALDSVRGLAALAVVGFHAYKDIVHGGPGGSGLGSTVAYSLDWGVAVFFVLSGFLIYLPFAEAIAGHGPMPDTRRFLWRRALRILPAYWLALAVFGTLAQPGLLWSPTGVIRYFLLLQLFDLATIYHVLATAWTLSIEMSFYLSLPLLAWAFAGVLGGLAHRQDGAGAANQHGSAAASGPDVPGAGRRAQASGEGGRTPGGTAGDPCAGPGGAGEGLRHLLAIAAFAGLGVAATELVIGPIYGALGRNFQLSYFTLLDAAPMFGAGMILAAIRAHRAALVPLMARLPGRLASAARRDATWLVLAAAGYAAALAFEGRAVTPWQPTYLAMTAAALLLVPLVLRPDGRASRVLGRSRPLAWLGAVSYGLYLWHWPVQELLMAHGWVVPHTWAGYILAVATVLAISLPLAWLTYRLVERPAIELSRRTNPLARISLQRPAAVPVVATTPPATRRRPQPTPVNRVG